jgi:tetratricopeptide (TPR) repeat protein
MSRIRTRLVSLDWRLCGDRHLRCVALPSLVQRVASAIIALLVLIPLDTIPYSSLFFSAVCSEATATPLPPNSKRSNGPVKARLQQADRSLTYNEQGAQAVKGRDFTRAEELFKKALSADPKNVTAAFNLASIYITNKNEAEAISLLTSYVEKNPSDAGLLSRLGDAYFSSGDTARSFDAYQKVHKIAPLYPGLDGKLGTLYTLRGEVNAAREMFEQAVTRNPRDSESLANLGALYVKLGRNSDGVKVALQALQVKPTPEAYITLGSAYMNMNEREHALNAFNRAVSLGDTSKELDSLVRELKNSWK